jgi:hypothetical protein
MSKLPPLQVETSTIDRVTGQLPGWKCYCCQDTGLVIRAERLVQDFDHLSVPLICKGCYAAADRFGDEALRRLDNRAPRNECQRLHDEAYEGWLSGIQNQHCSQSQPAAASVASIGQVMPAARDEMAADSIGRPAPTTRSQRQVEAPVETPCEVVRTIEAQAALTSADGFSVGDRVVVAIDHLDDYDQREIIKNNEAPVGLVGTIAQIKESEVAKRLGFTAYAAVVRSEGNDRHELLIEYLRRAA